MLNGMKEKDRARDIVKYAKRIGRLIQKPCSICGNARSEAHHHDYSLPLNVEWFCRKHHIELHKKDINRK